MEQNLQEQIKLQDDQDVISRHNYSVWQGKNGKWYTYIVDYTKDNNKKLVKRKNRDDITSILVDYYKQEDAEKILEESKRMEEINIFNIVTGRYLISPYGDIYDIDKKDYVNTFIHDKHGNYKGQKYVRLITEHGSKEFSVARLTMSVYNCPPPSSMKNPVVDHINKDSFDNYYKNLRWMELNRNASIRNNRQVGEGNSQAILSAKDVKHICNLMVKGASDLELSSMYNVSEQTINSIRIGKTWKHISSFFEFP